MFEDFSKMSTSGLNHSKSSGIQVIKTIARASGQEGLKRLMWEMNRLAVLLETFDAAARQHRGKFKI